MHIGLVGGIGPAATEYYYRGLVRANSTTSRALELTIVQADMNTLLSNLSSGAAQAQAEIFRRHVEQLAGAQSATEEQRELFFSAGARLCSEQGAESVVLAGTDMFLAFDSAEPEFDYIDSAEIHISALARLAEQDHMPSAEPGA